MFVTRSVRMLAGFGLATSVLFAASGCLITSSSSSSETGIRISPSTLAQVEVDQTTEAWLLAALGDPDRREIVNAGPPEVVLLTYTYERRTSSDGSLFLIFDGSSSHSEVRRTFFELTDGVVTRYWTEHGS